MIHVNSDYHSLMAQRKKDGVRSAILEAAFRQFSERGYTDTTIPQIARGAGISTANVYVYFGSKLDILYTLYQPWLEARLQALDATLARIAAPAARLERVLFALWHELPQADGGFANNVMQAVSTSGPSGEYSPALRRRFEARIGQWLQPVLGLDARAAAQVAGVVLMAFDGYAMNARLPGGARCTRATARTLASLLTARG